MHQAGLGGEDKKKWRLEELARELRDLRLKAEADHPEVTMEYLLVNQW